MNKKFPCPCCGNKTLDEEPGGTYCICPVCFWEDDGLQLSDPNYQEGANTVSLNQAKENYKEFGVSEKRFEKDVRKPNSDEVPD